MIALEGPLPRVSPHVSRKIGRSQKPFVAFRAPDRKRNKVNDSVDGRWEN